MDTQYPEFGSLNFSGRAYGSSVNGIPIDVFEPENHSPEMLIIGSMHGDESAATVLLSECLRSIQKQELKAAVILTANPDGVLAGTRCNANGVDLNRNYPSNNWKPDQVYYRNRPGEPQNISLSPGSSGSSEPETQALIKLVNELHPKLIVSIHGFLDCVDDPESTEIARDIAKRSDMDLVPDVGYKTPGSFGSWCAEKDISIITYELPSMGLNEMRKIHNPVFRDLITGFYDHLIK